MSLSLSLSLFYMSYKPLYFLPLLPRFTSSSSLLPFSILPLFFSFKKIASKSGFKLLYESSETMRLENSKKNKLPWPKTLVKKWFNTKTKAQDFHADDVLYRGVDEDWKHKHKFSKRETFNIKKSKTG
ncbi:uncharacterized protein LOC128279389 [Gossypium arboreum]|uniref:uncharacterized protein LOC128279389 n=1 Tax=Gossypium arboreum TaxID=29729 RepID=UPI0022F14CCE|nr:uncharacterized protein LOC128279389 [Gossypium arboreum]